MAFADPQLLDFAGDIVTLPRVSFGDETGKFRFQDETGGLTELTLTHQRGKRNRHTLRMNVAKVAEDPILETNRLETASISLSLDAPPTGFSNTELKEAILAITGWLTDSTAANTVKFIGGQS